MHLDDFDYRLPPDLIAQAGVEPRDAARLLVADRRGETIADHHVADLPELLDPGDLLVVNDSRVIPARVFGYRAGLGVSGRVELLLLRRLDEAGLWSCLARPARRLRPGSVIFIEGVSSGTALPSRGVVEAVGADGERSIRFDDAAAILARGVAPLPPYIRQPVDADRYQTLFARQPGSAAAPTAGLHFTPTLVGRLRERGIVIASVTLHIGVDTFRPVDVSDPRDHVIHREWLDVPLATVDACRQARNAGRRVVAVGTTSVRSLESAARGGSLEPWSGDTDLYILPGHNFRVVAGLMTNFHLPRSTLLMLVSAFAGRAFTRRVYDHAVAERYRFYSLGDACLFL